MARSAKPALSALAGLLLAAAAPLQAEPVPVRYTEGLVHGFLVLRNTEGQIIADGDLIQVPRGDQVSSRLSFRFRDGSFWEDAVVFSQRRQFRLLSEHLVQRGPSFPRTLESLLDTRRGTVSVRYTDDDGKEKSADERLDLPADLANGLMSVLLKNVRPEAPPVLSMLAMTPKPRLVKVKIQAAADDPFSHGESQRKATHYVLAVEIGGLPGLIAPLVGKQPPESHVWILQGDAPAFLKSDTQLYVGGPTWQIELASPRWPSTVPLAR
jgi:hypothetical protein